MVNQCRRDVCIITVAGPQGIARRDQLAARPTQPIQPPRSQAAFQASQFCWVLISLSRAWRARILNLLMELQTRKLVERGKRIVQRELGLSEHEALLVLQRQSQQRMKAIILSAEVRQSIATD
jgi:AmiR/NasT family two-component response regulator